VLLIGNTTGWTCGIAHADIANGAKGALAVSGGVYEVTNLDNAADGAKVYWNDSVNKVTTTSTNNAVFGFVVELGAAGANSACLCKHEPFV
jgi:predicted RecA/RadA family phage recombinase